MNISILPRHSRNWVSDVNYEGYKVDGIVVGHSISFVNMKTLILSEHEIDTVTKDIEIRYIVEGSSCSLKIKNDMGVKLYFEVKKNASGIDMYPLCIDTTDKIVGEIRNFDCSQVKSYAWKVPKEILKLLLWLSQEFVTLIIFQN